MSDGSDKLKFATMAFRSAHHSDYFDLAPIAAPSITSYGGEAETAFELALALSELAEEARPTTVARYLLPDDVRLETVEVHIARSELPGKLGKPLRAVLHAIVVPEPRPEIGPAGFWVFIPVLDHAFYLARKEELAARVQSEVAALPAAIALDANGWKRLVSWTPGELAPLAVELATTPIAATQGRKALAELERKRLATATLDSAGRRMTVPDGAPPLVGRADQLGELTRLLAGPRRSVLLVGDEAAGKSALVSGWLAAQAAHGPSRVWATSVAELVAGASGHGQWQERIAAVLAAAETLDAILYFDDFGALFADRPGEGGVDLGGAMRRHVVDGRVRVVGELTAVALDRAERRDVSLIGAMSRVHVAATDPATTIAACEAWIALWRRTQPHKPQIAVPVAAAAVELARRFLPYRAFPGKAVRLLEELRASHDGNRTANGTPIVLGEHELFTAFSQATGIPLALLSDDRALSRHDVIRALRQRMVGQAPAVERVADAICIAKARLQPADKPLASLMFVGPSGVGKTELARSVAAYLYGSADRMVRLDMSEYTDPWAAERLFGDASGEEGRLTAAVRSQPFGVVLLDEIEKAHASVFDLLLQVLGEARLTDSRGRTTYFHNAIIVLTSNLGTRGAKAPVGLVQPADDDRETRRYRDAVLAAFRPELINRLDQIVVFHPLRADEITRVAEIALGRLGERRGLTQIAATLDVSPAALQELADGGFSPELGARALRRHLDSALIAPCARLIARAGSDAHGGTLTVRTRDEVVTRPAGSRIGELIPPTAPLTITLWRRAASTGRRMIRSALALGELRRLTDREFGLAAAQAVRAKMGELEATLASATRKKLPGNEIARLSAEHARLLELYTSCDQARGELHAAEDLCLEALARDIDAMDLVDSAIGRRAAFRSTLFWLLVALRHHSDGAFLLVHSPDARPAVTAWAHMVVTACVHEGWTPTVHLWGETAKSWFDGRVMWGPPHDANWVARELAAVNPPSLLLRVAGRGANLLLGLEGGLQRFHGLAGAPCHVWVDPIEPRIKALEAYAEAIRYRKLTETLGLLDIEWLALPTPATRPPRGAPIREQTIDGTIVVGDREVDLPWRALGGRLREAAVERVLAALATATVDKLWQWERAFAEVEKMLASTVVPK